MDKVKKFLNFMDQSFDMRDLEIISKEVSQLKNNAVDPDVSAKYVLLEKILKDMTSGQKIPDILRGEIHSVIKSGIDGVSSETSISLDFHEDIIDRIQEKQEELRDLMDSLHKHMGNRSIEEASAFFSTMLDLISQVCVQKTEGVIVVRTFLHQILDIPQEKLHSYRDLQREISIVFIPEEIAAIQQCLPSIPDDDPKKTLFTQILDQASDTLRFNELSGYLLLHMTKYFLDKMEELGLNEFPYSDEFQRRHKRSKAAFDEAVSNIRDLEAVIAKHLLEKPILTMYPKYVRGLIKMKLGLANKALATEYKKMVISLRNKYTLARSAATFEFYKFPELQHELRLKQRYILNLQRDILNLMSEKLQGDFEELNQELNRLTEEIAIASERLDTRSVEFKTLLEKKNNLQKKVVASQKQLDVLHCQTSLIEVHQKYMKDAIKRFNENKEKYASIEEKIHQLHEQKMMEEKIKQHPSPTTDMPDPHGTRMVNAKHV